MWIATSFIFSILSLCVGVLPLNVCISKSCLPFILISVRGKSMANLIIFLVFENLVVVLAIIILPILNRLIKPPNDTVLYCIFSLQRSTTIISGLVSLNKQAYIGQRGSHWSSTCSILIYATKFNSNWHTQCGRWPIKNDKQDKKTFFTYFFDILNIFLNHPIHSTLTHTIVALLLRDLWVKVEVTTHLHSFDLGHAAD